MVNLCAVPCICSDTVTQCRTGCAVKGVWSKRRQTKTATRQNGDTKTATDCPDQNGDKLNERQAKTATGIVC